MNKFVGVLHGHKNGKYEGSVVGCYNKNFTLGYLVQIFLLYGVSISMDKHLGQVLPFCVCPPVPNW